MNRKLEARGRNLCGTWGGMDGASHKGSRSLLMNSKGGVFTTLAAVMMLTVLGASIAQVMAAQESVGTDITAGKLRDVKLAWVNARYLADKAVSKAIYDAGYGSCSDPRVVDASGTINTALGKINGVDCSVDAANCASGNECTFTLTCKSADESVQFEDGVSVTKTAAWSLDSETRACTVTVTDSDSGIVEIP